MAIGHVGDEVMVTDDPLATIAWRDFLLWAIRIPEIRAAFTADTGKRLPFEGDKAALAAMIDAATGYREHLMFEFTRWVTVNYFGLDQAPASFQAACKAAK